MSTAETLSPSIPPDVEELANELLRQCDAIGCHIATAESCTGGLLASLLTDLDGLGHCFERGFVCYTNSAKHEMLGVSMETLNTVGAVSGRTAIEMAEGALRRSGAGIAASVTGFAGPAGPGQEPGLVHFAVARREGQTVHQESHFGDLGRGQVRLKSLRTILRLCLTELRGST